MAIQPIEILLVEDSEDDIELTLDALQQAHIANRMHIVRDGREALDFVFGAGETWNSDLAARLILLDIKLPLVDGIEVLRALKRDARTRRVPVVMLTSSREERDMVEAYDLGVNSYIVKPVDFDQFRDVVAQLGLYWLILNQHAPAP